MHLGPVRYQDDAVQQARKRPFEHFIIPRFTALQAPLGRDENEVVIQEWYARMVDDHFRNEQIVDDVVKNYQEGRNCIVLTQRTAHVTWLAGELEKKAGQVMSLTGGLGAKKTREILQQVATIPPERNFILVATGSFIGEGFDEPRLDTLFLAMPISRKGTLQQYAGRLHRLAENKKEVRIYDYIDIHVKMLEKMYQKRLRGYASMGYKVKAEAFSAAPDEIIFDQNTFLPVFSLDIAAAASEILIVSPFVRKGRTARMLKQLQPALAGHVEITVVTRPPTDFKYFDQRAAQSALDLLTEAGINMVYKVGIHQKFAVMDRKLAWYGSINLMSYGSAQESIMRISSANITHELLKSLEKR